MMADLNGLKKINDTGGHSKGDLYIKNAALLMIDIFGAKSVYRIGGDEFLVVKDDVEYEEFKEKIKKLHSLATERNISISTGYVCSNDASISFEELMNQADKKLYSEKKKYYSAQNNNRRA